MDPTGILLAVVALGAITAALIPIMVSRRRRLRRRRVESASAALGQLAKLNDRYVESARSHPPIRRTYRAFAGSKSKLDRFDLVGFVASSLLDDERALQTEIRTRRDSLNAFFEYELENLAVASALLGRSNHPNVPQDGFDDLERSLFAERTLTRPTPVAEIHGAVTYASAGGQKQYTSRLAWNYEQLRRAMRMEQERRESLSTTRYLRDRERSLMTPKLRTDILRRDGLRCQFCGDSAAQGAILHVDHITPVSLGGRTLPENLQTLCQTCNLGKSNRFVG